MLVFIFLNIGNFQIATRYPCVSKQFETSIILCPEPPDRYLWEGRKRWITFIRNANFLPHFRFTNRSLYINVLDFRELVEIVKYIELFSSLSIMLADKRYGIVYTGRKKIHKSVNSSTISMEVNQDGQEYNYISQKLGHRTRDIDYDDYDDDTNGLAEGSTSKRKWRTDHSPTPRMKKLLSALDWKFMRWVCWT